MPCLGELKLDPALSEEAAFERQFEHLGEAEVDHHWTNHVVDDGKGTVIWHLVPGESGEGRQAWDLKSFRDGEEGPTPLTQLSFATREEAQARLERILGTVRLVSENKTKTRHYPDGTDVRVETENGKVSSFEVRSPHGRYACENQKCGCVGGY